MTTTFSPITVGSVVRFSHPLSSGGLLNFNAKVVKLEGTYAWVEMPERVRSIPFAPLGGKRYGKYAIAALKAAR